MAVIGNVTTTGSSIILNLDYLPERLLLGSIGSNADFSNFSVVASGQQLMSLTNAARFRAVAKFDNQLFVSTAAGSSEVLQYLRLATGRINKQTTIQATDSNSAASYPYVVQAASTNICQMARRAVESSINPSANGTFNNFEALFIEPTNFLRAQLTFDNGFTDEYTPAEVRALFAAYNQSDFEAGLGGYAVSGYSVISGETPYGNISQAVIYTTSGGSCVVVKTDYVQL